MWERGYGGFPGANNSPYFEKTHLSSFSIGDCFKTCSLCADTLWKS